ncbi:MAG TPA: malto-oligosyltrehalose trehalohydrolase [Caulobacteraceae bacterium]|jgi:malto-oligosyltrehalose trehalohydrolase
MRRFARQLAAGAELVGAGRARFRLWAPSRQQVGLEIDGQPPIGMRCTPGGWFEAEGECGPGARYRYRVKPGLSVPDPASRLQADDVHGPSVVVDPAAYAWRHDDWLGRPWREAVIYELHAGLLGGFSGVAERLPALAALGVTAIELMPVADFPGARNWGYDGVLPYAPDRAYGAPDDLKALVDQAHGLGLCVILDVVYNHFDPDGNYLAGYAPAFFREDRTTPWGGAVDVRQPAVRRFFIDNALYWLMEYRFDGLRFDAVHAIPDHADFLDAMAAEIRAAVEPGRQVWLLLENGDNDAEPLRRGYDGQWNDDVHHALHVLLTGERDGYYGDYDQPAARLARGLAEGFIYQGEGSAHAGGAARGSPSADLPVTAFVDFLQNHDQVGNRAFGERLTTLADPDALRAAVGLLLLSPHIPLLFMGEEVGARTPFLFFADHGPDLADAVREGRRREFARFARFADPAERARIPDPNAPATYEASRPEPGPDADAWRALYRELLALRARHVAPRLDGARSLGAAAIGERAVAARWRLGDGAVLALAANFGTAPAALPWTPGAPLTAIGEASADGRIAPRSFAAWLAQP